jgi:nitroreductase
MDVLETIMTRRSIRKFTGVPIDKEKEEKILRAGFQAPSAHDYQPWEYIVIRDMTVLKSISSFHPYAKMLENAGFAIMVCGDVNKQKSMGFLVADCSASIQNMLLAAHGIGLGAVWCGIYGSDNLVDKAKEVLNLPSYIVPIGLVVIGNKDAEKEPKNRYDENKVHYNKW